MKNKELLVAHYNEKYKNYRCNTKDLKKAIMESFPKERCEAACYYGRGNGRALEIGAGDGEVACVLKDYYDEYVCTELSLERANRLKKIAEDDPKLRVLHNDLEEKKLPFPPNYFDTIIMFAVIEHLIELISAIKYCISLLKPGGKILINTPNIAKWTRRLKLLCGRFPSTGALNEGFLVYNNGYTDLHDEGHLHYFTFRSLRILLKDKGHLSKVKYCGFGKTFLSRLCPSLFSECLVIGIK